MRGNQLRSRFSILELGNSTIGTKDGKAAWRKLVAGFEASLPLRHHEKGTLTELAGYLYSRTGGSIGSLSRLITGSAIQAITDPTISVERVDEDLLSQQVLDGTAESFYANYRAGNRKEATA